MGSSIDGSFSLEMRAGDLYWTVHPLSLQAVGLGLRWRLTEKFRVNFRVDYAWGKDDDVLLISVGEAFWHAARPRARRATRTRTVRMRERSDAPFRGRRPIRSSSCSSRSCSSSFRCCCAACGYAARRRARPRPSRPSPSSASGPGSGTSVTGVQRGNVGSFGPQYSPPS